MISRTRPPLLATALAVVAVISLAAGPTQTIRSQEPAPVAETPPVAEAPPAGEQPRRETPNRLADERSPYLLQHAYNPVDWYPWGEEAFEKAKEEGKPIFLSIGYATCHWCHVMERESFEDPAIAEIINKSFVPIKLDREERPDVDEVYMTFHSIAQGGGGWPLNLWLTPDLEPLFSATYLAPNSQPGAPSFRQVLLEIEAAWEDGREEIEAHSKEFAGRIRLAFERGSEGTPPPEEGFAARWGAACYNEMAQNYVGGRGGFGGAPWFPQPGRAEFLIDYALNPDTPQEDREHATEMVTRVLEKMADGGIHDHIGGGFHRYAVDSRWHVPHFEKMLYDQAQIATAYLRAHQLTGREDFAVLARDVFSYVESRLTSPNGAFYSAEDADSLPPGADEESHELHEGAYYTWTEEQIHSVLGAELSPAFIKTFGVQEVGNALPDSDPRGELAGLNVLHRIASAEEVAADLGIHPEAVEAKVAAGLDLLRPVREERTRPLLDDKITTAWNALMISAYATGYQALGDEAMLASAEGAMEFILGEMMDPEGDILYRTFRGDRSETQGMAIDYAATITALLDLYECTFQARYLETARDLQNAMMTRFWDEKSGGFYAAAETSSDLLYRMKGFEDGAMPSTNSLSLRNLLRLSKTLGDPAFGDAAVSLCTASRNTAEGAPLAITRLIGPASWFSHPPAQLMIATPPVDPKVGAAQIAQVAWRLPNRGRVILLADGAENSALIGPTAPAVAAATALDGSPTLYLCRDFQCQLPTSDLAEAAAQIVKALSPPLNEEAKPE